MTARRGVAILPGSLVGLALLRSSRRLLPAAVCALAAHALVYRSLLPSDGVHGYFAWYEPAVAGLSVAAVFGLVVAVTLAACGRRPLAGAFAGRSVSGLAREIGGAGFAVLLVQESLERSMSLGHPAFASFAPSGWLLLVAGIAVASLTLAFALRAGAALVRRVLALPPRPAPAARAALWVDARDRLRVPRPLAGGHAMRAPPPPLAR